MHLTRLEINLSLIFKVDPACEKHKWICECFSQGFLYPEMACQEYVGLGGTASSSLGISICHYLTRLVIYFHCIWLILNEIILTRFLFFFFFNNSFYEDIIFCESWLKKINSVSLSQNSSLPSTTFSSALASKN